MGNEKERNCPGNSFGYHTEQLNLSQHAYQRMLERGRCFSMEEVEQKIKEILMSGYESLLKKKNCPKERVITFRELCLHIKESTITTVTYNNQFFMTGAA